MALRIAKVSRPAALFAVEHWHYSRRLPAGKTFIRGVWEDDRFIGVVTLSRGATPYLGRAFGLDQTECVELTRVALAEHHAPVSQIVAAVLRDFKRATPGVRLVLSFADPEHGHHGGIYQAGNWVYLGPAGVAPEFVVHGTRMHMRSLHAKGWRQTIEWLHENVDPDAYTVDPPPKHKYAMPLDRQMARRVARMARPYPARVEVPHG